MRGRPAQTLERAEYLTRARELAARGQDLPQSKLLVMDIIQIRSAVRQREALRKFIADNLSNAALARIYGVHVKTIEKVISREIWSHVP